MESAPRQKEKVNNPEETYKPYATQEGAHAFVSVQERFYQAGNKDPSREFIQEQLSDIEGKVVVDMGCGSGADLITYADMGASQVIGVEPAEGMRAIAKENLEKVEGEGYRIDLVGGEFDNIPLEDNSVDVVVARFSLHILSDFEHAFSEVARVLKEGGKFVVVAGHPEADAKTLKQQGKQMGDRIEFKIFENGVAVNNGTHTMEEYTGEIPGRYFVVAFQGQTTFEEADDASVPTELQLVYIKKEDKSSAV